jgi:Na+/H+ antiporter NhaD/arsenite permease-like protein
LFAAIFVTIGPVIAILQAGARGALGPVATIVTGPNGVPDNAMYFVMTGTLSAFLDNAPTYLVFFNLAGGDPQVLMGTLAGTLAGISMGAVYFGALTYVGNAPNFMIRAIAEDMGVRMPSFFAYFGWALLLLALPLTLIALTIG